MKLVIVFVLICCSYFLGDYVSKIYTNRHKQVSEIIKILEAIRCDISFGLYTLEDIFRKVGGKTDFYMSKFFNNLFCELSKSTEKTLDEIIKQNILSFQKESYLTQKDFEELKEVLLNLGKSDITSQQRLIDLSIENFKKITFETKEDIEKKGNVYKKLAVIMGIMISIILI